MSEKFADAVWIKPRRRFGFGAFLAAVGLAVALLVSGMSGSSNAASTTRHVQHVQRHDAASPQQQQAINAKVNRLLGELTVAEKFGQLEMAGPAANDPTNATLESEAAAGQIGSVLDLTGAANINAVQNAAVGSVANHHIPLIFGLDVIHGYRTMFPVPLGESATWDPAQVQKDEAVSADEAAADGIKWTFNPMVDISRDPRWGRVVEGAGEDPFLGSAIAAAKVEGYQGNNFAAPNRVAATIKHFGGYGAPVAGREYNTVDMSTQQLFNDYLPPYKAAVDAGAATVMSSFNSLNGVPNTANPYMLTQILRDEWGFNGTTLSDYQAVQELEDFGYASDGEDAARLALTAGENIEMAVSMTSTNPVYNTYGTYGPTLLHEGKITMTQLNDAVRHVLTLKYLAGMFSNPDQGSVQRYNTEELTQANQNVALQTAEESLVLLNNNNHALPLSPSVGKVAVVGPLADDAVDQLGPDVPIGYSESAADTGPGGADKIVTVRQGIENVVGANNVDYVDGCANFTVADPCNETTGFQAAAAAAATSAVTVIVVGEPAGDTGEASSRTSLDLPGQQEALISQIAATGRPYVIVLMNGRPLTIPELGGDPTTHAGGAPAMLEAWFPGTTGGTAIANALFGKFDPSGKLTMSFPQNVGQIPMSYNELPTGRPYDPNNKYTSRYLDVSNAPEYPFGYGLSYTSFSIGSPQIQGTPSRNGTFRVSATVKNTGSTAGVDVAQLYIHESDTPILQPVEKLEGFQRTSLLAPGQSQTVTFTLGPQNLGYYDNNGHFAVVPGTFDMWVGDSSTADSGTPTTFTVG
jgi:beta-glucosidase